jgi:hypothetical protein
MNTTNSTITHDQHLLNLASQKAQVGFNLIFNSVFTSHLHEKYWNYYTGINPQNN